VREDSVSTPFGRKLESHRGSKAIPQGSGQAILLASSDIFSVHNYIYYRRQINRQTQHHAISMTVNAVSSKNKKCSLIMQKTHTESRFKSTTELNECPVDTNRPLLKTFLFLQY